MTLITYLMRVHFADGVLEEALRSEMERHGKRRPLIISSKNQFDGPNAERLFSSFPIRTKPETFVDTPAQATEAAAIDIAQHYADKDCDHLIALGSTAIIDLAKAARLAISFDEPLAALSREEGGSTRIDASLPGLFAVPDISGFASAVSDYSRVRLKSGDQILLFSKFLRPSVTICDPTLALGTAPEICASAVSGIIGRGVDAYLSRNYNPPADGLALDGVSRITSHLARIVEDDSLATRRETMAGALNSALSLQKGLCVIHAICQAIASVPETPIDVNAVARLIMPGLVDFYGDATNGKTEALKRHMQIDLKTPLADGLAAMMQGFPLPDRLSDMGLTGGDLTTAAQRAARDRAITTGPRPIGQRDIEEILTAVH